MVTLTRKATGNGARPEFLSLTFLPGRGMNVFQIKASIPGRGDISVLNSPSVETVAARLNGTGMDRTGGASVGFGEAFLIPYPNRIFGQASPDGTTLTTQWHGRTIVLPAFPRRRETAATPAPAGPPDNMGMVMHGLILKSQAQDVQTQTTADGQTATAVIHAGDFGGHWLSKTDLHFTFALTGEAVDETITATNVGSEDEPIAIGAHPYFALPSGDRGQARIHVPASMMAVVNNYHQEFPTGQLKPVKGTIYDYRSPEGAALDDHALDDNFSHLQRTHGAVEVKVIDPAANYGVDVDGLSPEIKTVQIYSPQGRKFVAVEEQFNFVDPFGKEWKGMDTGMVTLHPGQSTTWRLRLRLFTPNAPSR
ncbi:aldose 1-epimerase [Paracidobacterium acidisoli]|uniref:aldose 1-epimerase n=1 Tax=Paracidobacterium acidisoli TaxID=2303751 RepID=UPI001313FB66|nr:aldose 1-epimerase [Paracidobacterium acidisoli]